MSFWPFMNSMNSSSLLQKFLDSVQDFSTVSVEDLIGDAALLRDLLDELHNIKGNFNLTNFQVLQQQANASTTTNAYSGGGNSGLASNSGSNESADNALFTSSNNDSTTLTSKDGRSTKLLELLIQPHILNGFLDYLIDGVDFFHGELIKEQEALDKLIADTEEASTAECALVEDTRTDQRDESENTGESLTNDSVDANGDAKVDTATEDEGEKESAEEKLTRCIQAASDVLSADLWVILNRIIETPAIMSKLWLILLLEKLDESSPLVSYLVHILDQLMDTNSIELLNFIRRQDKLVDTFLAKVDIPMLMDFFLRIIQTDKPDSPTGILEVLSQQQLIPKLIDILKPHESQFAPSTKIPNQELFFKQIAATDFIKALVTISSNTALAVVLETNIGPNQLTRELVSPAIVHTMIDDIILYRPPSGPRTNKHGINNCVGIVIELIRKNNSDYDLNCGSYSQVLHGENGTQPEMNSYVMFQWLKDFEQNPPGLRDAIYLGDMLGIFSDALPQLTRMMKEDEEDEKSGNPSLTSDAPRLPLQSPQLGFTKFKLAELVAELLHCSNMILLNSKKIRRIIKIRDHVREQQHKRLRKALADTIRFDEDTDAVQDVTTGLDDVSLDDIHFDDKKREEENDYLKLLETLDTQDDSDDEEPMISPENPFVCMSRDSLFRLDPCVGDLFKIKLIDLGMLPDIVCKFKRYPWHNFFHNVVFDLVQQIFNGKLNSYNSFLIVELFEPHECDLANMIVESYKTEAVPRPGYMGHLILISEEVVKFTLLYKPDLISPVIVDAILSESWEWFVSDVLLKTREVYNVVLGQESEDIDEDDHHDNDREYGFDSLTVGYLDMDGYNDKGDDRKSTIILGDKSNHALFINDLAGIDDDGMEEVHMPDVRVQNMSPSGHIQHVEDDDDDDDHSRFHDSYHDAYADNLSGSSSSDEDENDDDDNGLRRVSKHNDEAGGKNDGD